MAAGLSESAKRHRTLRFLRRWEKWAGLNLPGAVAERKPHELHIHNAGCLNRTGWAKCVTIALHWGNFSNGESIGTVSVKAMGYEDNSFGQLVERIKKAYAAVSK